jgi:endonuclease III
MTPLLTIFIVLFVIFFVAWVIIRMTKGDDTVVEIQNHDHESATPDDLTKIEGIGPKISATMQTARVTTFAQMADTSVERLAEILQVAQIRLGNPSTWPEQAKLAAEGQWEALKTLQDELDGGRRE